MPHPNKGTRKHILEGTKQGEWEVLEYRGFRKPSQFYLCKCVCGIVKEVAARGPTLQSNCCGCIKPTGPYRKSYRRKEFIYKYKALIRRYKHDAAKRNIEYNLNNQQFEQLVEAPCYYCGKEKSNKQTVTKTLTRDIVVEYNGIDRVDNAKGYIGGNCVPCCFTCNSLKKSVSKEIIEKAYKFLFGEQCTQTR